MKAYLDGVPAAAVGLPDLERAVLYGDGVFETFVVESGRVRGLGLHRDRLLRSARRLAFDVDLRAVREDVETALAAEQLERAVVRVTLVRRGAAGLVGLERACARWVHVGPLPQPRNVGLRCVLRPLSHVVAARGAKVTAYADAACALRDAHARGADDVIGHDSEGHILEATTSNVVVLRGGVLSTPSTAFPILPGVTRALVLEQARALGWVVRERAIRVHELYGADEVILTSSVRGVVGVRVLDDRTLPDADPFRNRLAEAVAALPGEPLSVVDEPPGTR